MSNISINEDSLENEKEKDFQSRIDLTKIAATIKQIKDEISKVIVGQEEMIDLLVTALLSNGHVLIEGVPGIAKTLTAKLLAKTIDAEFGRIQFTPDLMPSDILGTSVFNPKEVEFEFKKGAIFADLILIDEINRAPAKTQAALFEVMEERKITLEGQSYEPGYPFLVFATQNPIDHEGTYNLPEAQLDRFLFKIEISYPSIDEEVQLLQIKHKNIKHTELENINAVIDKDEIRYFQQLVHQVIVEEKIMRYIVEIVNKTREHHSLFVGASPRASIALLNASKAYAASQGRDFVTPEDVKYLTSHVLRHRIIPTPEKEIEGIGTNEIIKELVESVEVPR